MNSGSRLNCVGKCDLESADTCMPCALLPANIMVNHSSLKNVSLNQFCIAPITLDKQVFTLLDLVTISIPSLLIRKP